MFHNVQLNTRVISHQQGASPWRCWRTWSPARFTWWKSLRPTAWVMGHFLIRWSWQYEQISPLVMIPGTPVAPHTPQVSGINIILTQSHDISRLRSSFRRAWNWFILRPHYGWQCCVHPSQPFLTASTTWTRSQWQGSLWESASLSSASSSALSSSSAEAKTGTSNIWTRWWQSSGGHRGQYILFNSKNPVSLSVLCLFVSLQEIFSC